MFNNRKVIIGVVVAAIVIVGIGLLGLGEAIYRHSDGERGWSVGAGLYELLGWDAEDYRSDFGRGRDSEDGSWDLSLVDEDGDGVPDRVRIPEEATFDRGFARGRRSFGFARGLFCLSFVAMAIVAGVLFYRRRRDQAQG
jgi:hypothetical protein